LLLSSIWKDVILPDDPGEKEKDPTKNRKDLIKICVKEKTPCQGGFWFVNNSLKQNCDKNHPNTPK